MDPIENAAHSVCVIERKSASIVPFQNLAFIVEQDSFASNGVFIAPDTILTCSHSLDNAEALTFINDQGETAVAKKGFHDPAIDIGIVFLDKPIGHHFCKVEGVDIPRTSLVKGWLLSRFQHQQERYEMHYGMSVIPPVKEVSNMACFYARAPVRFGYSGSPLFNEAGAIISFISHVDGEIAQVRHANDHRGEQGIIDTRFYGPPPKVVAAYVEEILALQR
jgi:hypothetical protein